MQRAIEIADVRGQGGDDGFIGLVGDFGEPSPICVGGFIPPARQQRRQQCVRRCPVRPAGEASGRTGDETTQDSKIAGAVARERLGPRFGDAGCGQGAGDPFARRPCKGADFAARDRPLVIGQQHIMTACDEGPRQTRFGFC